MEIIQKSLYLIFRPSMKGTTIPMFYYTFAETEEEAIYKVRFKWGEYDKDIQCRKLKQDEIDELVISTNNF